MKVPRLSVVIPFYDEERTIEPLVNKLRYIFNKDKINYELILVDNGSKDNTFEIIDKLSKKKQQY